MAIYINGQKVAGRGPVGPSGKTPYEVAMEKDPNLSLTEEEYNEKLINIGNAASIAYVDNAISEATASIVTDVWSRGNTPPSNPKIFWINKANNGLYFYSGNSTEATAVANPENWTLIPALWS